MSHGLPLCSTCPVDICTHLPWLWVSVRRALHTPLHTPLHPPALVMGQCKESPFGSNKCKRNARRRRETLPVVPASLPGRKWWCVAAWWVAAWWAVQEPASTVGMHRRRSNGGVLTLPCTCDAFSVQLCGHACETVCKCTEDASVHAHQKPPMCMCACTEDAYVHVGMQAKWLL